MSENFENDLNETNEPKEPFTKSAMRYGAYLGVSLIAITMLLQLANYGNAFNLGFYLLFFLLGGLFITMHHYRNKILGGYITYSHCLKFGIMVSLLSSLIISAYVVVNAQWINRSWIENSAMETEEKYREREEQIPESFRELMEKSIDAAYQTKPIDLGKSLILNQAIFGGIFSLILGLFIKRKPPLSFD